MARINLLPWRQERRQERQKFFMSVLAGGFVFSVSVLYGVVSLSNNMLNSQDVRNKLLQNEISHLDKRIQEIKMLDVERGQLITRMNVIQQLQLSRPKIVKIFDSLVRMLPEGIHLEKVERIKGDLILDGIAQSNARISIFMQKIESNPDFEEPKLQVIQRVSSKDDAIRKFTLLVRDAETTQQQDATTDVGAF